MEELQKLREDISRKEAELSVLKAQLQQTERESSADWKWPLRRDEYERYGRQLILPSIGIKGQLRLKKSSVLVIGAGGLGCPAATYLAGAGVGVLGLVDGDVVEASNLHRQIAHSTASVGMPKTESAVLFLKELNPNVIYQSHGTHINPENAEDIISRYDVVLDCTDHPTSRYLISDICVLLQKPLVSASAFRTDGQLIVLNNPAAPQGSMDGGPCYRCVFPKPPPPDTVVSCGEGGILGPIVGTMGVLQALEAIKLIAAGAVDVDLAVKDHSPPSLLIFSGMSSTPFRSVRMRSRRKDCFACSSASDLTAETLRSGSVDYVKFCGVNLPLDLLQPEERTSATRYKEVLSGDDNKHLLLDVREPELFEIGRIPGAVSLPLAAFMNKHPAETSVDVAAVDWIPTDLPPLAPIFVVCRVGNDSQLVTRRLKEIGLGMGGERYIGDIQGGMRAWRDDVDPTFPFL